jgi:hypothetical protein
MNKKEICIIVPIYKEDLNNFEIQSINQCIKVLSDYSIHFACPEGLNMDFYKLNFKEVKNYTFFDKTYFKTIESYSRLMLSPHFYEKFIKYNYMLLYQTDCYVFRDELLDWVNKKYDYIGGVWFDDYHGNPYNGAKMWHAGNGGLSLRNINRIMAVLSSKRPLKNYWQLLKERKLLSNMSFLNFLKWYLILPLRLFGYKNNFKYLADNYTLNEDAFFMEACLLYHKIKTPLISEAISFSWDKYPKFLFDNFGKLPFGCHAWYRDDLYYEGNKEFWLQHIPVK